MLVQDIHLMESEVDQELYFDDEHLQARLHTWISDHIVLKEMVLYSIFQEM